MSKKDGERVAAASSNEAFKSSASHLRHSIRPQHNALELIRSSFRDPEDFPGSNPSQVARKDKLYEQSGKGQHFFSGPDGNRNYRMTVSPQMYIGNTTRSAELSNEVAFLFCYPPSMPYPKSKNEWIGEIGSFQNPNLLPLLKAKKM